MITACTARLAKTVLSILTLGLILSLNPASAQEAERGQKLFDLCAMCHGADGGGMQIALAPAIAGLDKWYISLQLRKFRDGGRGMHIDDISGMRMRPMAMWLTGDEDIEAVAEYVSILPPVIPEPTLQGGDPKRGEALYVICRTCHGPKGAGMQALNAPPINRGSDWYFLDQLKKYKSGVRGTVPADVTGALMRPMAMTLANEQAMKDVIAHAFTLAE